MLALGKDVYDYVTQDPEAGTTTISADFVNLVLQAYKQYQEENGAKFDGTMEPGENGYYCFPDFRAIFYDYGWESGSRNYYQVREWTNICTRLPCAVLARNDYWDGRFNNYTGYIVFYSKDLDEFYCNSNVYENGVRDEELINMSSQQFIDGYFFPVSSEINNTHLHVVYGDGSVNDYDHAKFESLGIGYYNPNKLDCSFSASSSSIPIYQSLAGLKQGLRNGDFSGAYNYGKMPDCETPAYTGTYDGGDITVPTEKLEGIQDKLDEIDQTDKDIYEKLKELLEWLIGNGGGTSGSIDLTTTNSWLEKIYAKVTQIFDKLSETVGGVPDTVHTKIQETLDDMLAQLKEISGDVSDIKGQLENMSEQEFDEKSDSFLGEIMDAFAEISEVVKTKFPFSIPNDLRIFLSKIAPAAPETGEQQLESYSLDSSGVSLYSGEHGGGGTSDGETNPPGGGGSSRPGSGFVGVDHGGSGGSRDPVEMREAPVFRLPIVIERYGIEEYIIIDMAPFDPLSRFSRSFFTIIFMVCLFNLTFKVIGMWGDLVG